MKKMLVLIQWIRYLPIGFFLKVDQRLDMDISRWKMILGVTGTNRKVLCSLLWSHKEFRNLVIYRNSSRPIFKRVLTILYPPLESLYIQAKEIGGGLFIQHGFATMIAAESLGENCWINQQVTIGYRDNTSSPVIGDNVTITCGAKVLGPIKVGNGATIGANAVVVKNVEPGATMVGIPARQLHQLR